MLQEDERPPCLGAVGRGAVWYTVHGEDVSVSGSHGVGLSRVTVLDNWHRLDEKCVQSKARPLPLTVVGRINGVCGDAVGV
jgi:hypothetical protein